MHYGGWPSPNYTQRHFSSTRDCRISSAVSSIPQVFEVLAVLYETKGEARILAHSDRRGNNGVQKRRQQKRRVKREYTISKGITDLEVRDTGDV